MAFIQCDFYSETLGLSCSMNVILPQATQSQIGMKGKTVKGRAPVLYLLHGLSDDHSIWMRRTSIERYVAALGLAVVMPAVHRSFYTNQANGYRYFDFIADELPSLVQQFFPVSEKREDNFVAGLSMGGYGAFKLALTRPQQYAAAASLSGALDVAGRSERWKTEPALRAELTRTFGDPDELKDTEHDIFHLLKSAHSTGDLPALYVTCGTSDFLYNESIALRDFAKKNGIPVTYDESPGEHEWGFWDRTIQDVLRWLPLRKPEA